MHEVLSGRCIKQMLEEKKAGERHSHAWISIGLLAKLAVNLIPNGLVEDSLVDDIVNLVLHVHISPKRVVFGPRINEGGNH